MGAHQLSYLVQWDPFGEESDQRLMKMGTIDPFPRIGVYSPSSLLACPKEISLLTGCWCDFPSIILFRSTSLAAMLDSDTFWTHPLNVQEGWGRISPHPHHVNERPLVPCGR